MQNKQKSIQFIVVMSALCFMAYNVLLLKASLFYLLYLYWFDECFRTVGAWARINSTQYIENFDGKDMKVIINGQEKPLTPKQSVNTRIFFLFLYFVFIVFGFGFMFALFNDPNGLSDNIVIFMFLNIGFNINLGIFLLREIVSYLYDFVFTKRFTAENPMPFPNSIDKQTIVLHLSIILGGGLWALSKHKLLFGIDFTEGNHAYVLIIPFVVIRLVMEIILFLKKENVSSTPL